MALLKQQYVVCLFVLLLVAFCLPAPAFAQLDSTGPVDLTADNLIHDEQRSTIRAEGDVELIQGDRILRAQRVVYNLKTDVVVAKGDVVLTEPNGDVHFFDKVSLSTELKEGFVTGVQSYLSGGGKLTAKKGTRSTLEDGGRLITLEDATYTPCECEVTEDGDYAWQIKADEVRYYEDDHRVAYKNAQFEVFGVPVLYTPYLSHPDNKVKQKSGFLTPSFGYNSDLGGVLTQNYYWALAENRDATFGTIVTTNEAPVALAEYRHRFTDAEIKTSGSVTYSDRTDDISGVAVAEDEELRGHVFAEGLWNINDNWRSGVDVEWASDDQYLRQYDFTGKNVLESQAYLERFEGRNYASGRLITFQDVRIRERQTDQPNVLPQIEADFKGDPNGLLSGRWGANISTLGLMRDDGQDMSRFIVEADWEKRLVTDFGLVNTLEVSGRGDLYHVSDRDLATAGSGRSNDGTSSRFFPQAHLVTSYPFVKPLKKAQIVVEPIASVTLATNIKDDNSDIPNEDSQDAQIDASNLFEANRFPGKDEIEDRSRTTYGLRTGIHANDGSFLSVFAGQSYRFDEADNPFPRGSGLSRQESDYVGQISGQYKDIVGWNYRTQIQSDNFSSQRHEFDGYADLGPLHLDTRYLYAKALEGTDIDDSREQARAAAAYDITEAWRVRGDVIYDLGVDDGLRESSVGVDYIGCCMSLSTTYRRSITSEATGESSSEIMFRIGLKGIGEFGMDDKDSWKAGNR